MKQVSIRPVWTIQDPNGSPLPSRLIELLAGVSEHGSLLLAARALGLSYRRAWDLVREAEQSFGSPLLHMARGRGSTLTELGARIVWADQRINARLTPTLGTLASELAEELRGALGDHASPLRVYASHGFAIERLVGQLVHNGLQVAISYASSSAAAAALREGDCDLAGLHIPAGPMEATALAHYRRWLQGMDLTLIDIAMRRQGLMVRAGNPKELYGLADLVRQNVRFVNRQPGSGTRLLLEGLLQAQGIDGRRIAGFEQVEHTHAAVAAYVASGMADVGLGLEPPARRFRLDFVPVATERYFLLCRSEALGKPSLQAVLQLLRDADFHATLQALPGYDPAAAGTATPLREIYPGLVAAG